ncbi:hypothetical protein CC86DRAFT_303828, partial [Ophiobolus disseminans]
HIFTVLGYNFVWAILYNSSNKNGKTTSKCYTEYVLPQLKAYLLEIGGDWILWQDKDSAHNSKKTLTWLDYHGIPYVILSPKSPDFSVMDT